MIRIGDRAFLSAWRAIRAATQPDAEATVWRAAEVRWCRHRYSHTTSDHAMTVEVHRLDHAAGRNGWSVMVVAEHWWDERHKSLRNNLWATHVSGSRSQATEWFARQARRFDRTQYKEEAQNTEDDQAHNLEEPEH